MKIAKVERKNKM